MKIKQLVHHYPITLTVAVNGILANFAVAFTSPTFAVLALLFTGAVVARGRHTVTRMILAAGVRVRHHAQLHRFFSQARWEIDDLWKGLVRLLAQELLSADGPVRIGIDDTAQSKTGAKIYGVGMVHDNRPAARKGWDLSWGLNWVVMTAMIRVQLWPGHVFASSSTPPICRSRQPRFCLVTTTGGPSNVFSMRRARGRSLIFLGHPVYCHDSFGMPLKPSLFATPTCRRLPSIALPNVSALG